CQHIVCFHSYFFFQAEDGIRDFHVTGVQTCALPICTARVRTPRRPSRSSPRRPRSRARAPRNSPHALTVRVTETRGPPNAAFRRSEERRVGKEGRSRWSPEH